MDFEEFWNARWKFTFFTRWLEPIAKRFARDAYEAASSAEVEECAKVCDQLEKTGYPENPEYGSWGEFSDAAKAIRNRKT